MKNFKISLSWKANIISLLIILCFGWIAWNILPYAFSETTTHKILINKDIYIIRGTIGGIGGHVTITISKKRILNYKYNKNTDAYYSTGDLSPVYYSIIDQNIHIFHSNEFTIPTGKNKLPIIFHDLADTSYFKDRKIVIPYCANW